MGLQIEDGKYTRIVNEILDQLVKRGLLGSEYQIILYIIRKTWGYNKTEDIISLTQFEQALNLSRHTVIKTIKNLEKHKILVKRSIPNSQYKAYKFNKYYNQWLVNPPALVQNKMKTSAIERLKLVKRSAHTKDNTKDNKRGLEILREAKKQLKDKIQPFT